MVVLTEDRLEAFPDIPCSGDPGYSAKLGSQQVFTALEGTPQEAIDVLQLLLQRLQAGLNGKNGSKGTVCLMTMFTPLKN